MSLQSISKKFKKSFQQLVPTLNSNAANIQLSVEGGVLLAMANSGTPTALIPLGLNLGLGVLTSVIGSLITETDDPEQLQQIYARIEQELSSNAELRSELNQVLEALDVSVQQLSTLAQQAHGLTVDDRTWLAEQFAALRQHRQQDEGPASDLHTSQCTNLLAIAGHNDLNGVVQNTTDEKNTSETPRSPT